MHSSDHGQTASGNLAHSSKGVCVFMWDSGPCQSQARSCSSKSGSRGAPVNACCVCGQCRTLGGRARCWLGPVHIWDRSRSQQVLACACIRGLVWSAHRSHPSCIHRQRSSISSISQTAVGWTPRTELGGSQVPFR